MIDTVILRLHDLEKYSQVIKCLDIYNNNGYSAHTGKIPTTELAELRKSGRNVEKEIIDILQMKRTGEFLIKTQVGKQMNASNHYAFTYYVNYTKDYIEFNFSIPKYKFGSNILMFVEHANDRDYKYYECSTLEYNIKKSYSLFTAFMEYFVKNEFILCKIDFKDIEVNRIDVCFNQMFRSKQEALLYLEYQKRLKKKFSRDEDGVMRDYTTSLMYVTKRYSAKIYHKGTEYTKNDMKEHLRINKEKGYEYFKTKRFQSFGDRILRYELTIRNGLINYMHKHSIFRKNCRWFKLMYKDYLRVETAMQKNERISKKIGSLSDSEKKKYMKDHPYEKICKDDRVVHKQVSKLLNKRRYFTLDAGFRSQQYNHETVNYDCDTVKFSKDLFGLCLNKLMEFIYEFQIKQLPEEEIIRRQIDQYNKLHIKQLPKNEMVQFYEQLLKYGSFKEAARFADISRATLYRYITRFRLIGISDKCIKPVDDGSTIPSAPLDLKEYHSVLLFDNDLLRGININ